MFRQRIVIMKTHIKRAVRHGISLLSCVTAMSQRDFCESENAAAWAAAVAAVLLLHVT